MREPIPQFFNVLHLTDEEVDFPLAPDDKISSFYNLSKICAKYIFVEKSFVLRKIRQKTLNAIDLVSSLCDEFFNFLVFVKLMSRCCHYCQGKLKLSSNAREFDVDLMIA
jgi:hypothetical protein